MPILEVNILGTKIEIDYQKNEKEKLIFLIEKFKQRLKEFDSLIAKFTDNKIILLAALKLEDYATDLEKKINDQDKTISLSNNKDETADKNIKEIVKLKDEISILSNKNIALKEKNNEILLEFSKLNKKVIALSEKIIRNNNED